MLPIPNPFVPEEHEAWCPLARKRSSKLLIKKTKENTTKKSGAFKKINWWKVHRKIKNRSWCHWSWMVLPLSIFLFISSSLLNCWLRCILYSYFTHNILSCILFFFCHPPVRRYKIIHNKMYTCILLVSCSPFNLRYTSLSYVAPKFLFTQCSYYICARKWLFSENSFYLDRYFLVRRIALFLRSIEMRNSMSDGVVRRVAFSLSFYYWCIHLIMRMFQCSDVISQIFDGSSKVKMLFLFHF